MISEKQEFFFNENPALPAGRDAATASADRKGEGGATLHPL